jgi:DNA-binding PadR family transcriptional regulator
MRSQVNWALLGLVIERPSYGYELATRFERIYGDLLHVSGGSHIYKALNALVTNRLISGSPVAKQVSIGTDRQPKVHYRETNLGRESYRAHLAEQMRQLRRHSQLLVRELAVLANRPQMALEAVDMIEEACLEEAIRAPIAPPPAGPHVDRQTGLLDRLAAEESRLAMEAKLPWVEYTRHEFKALAQRRPSHG